jgi:hypothetical protein
VLLAREAVFFAAVRALDTVFFAVLLARLAADFAVVFREVAINSPPLLGSGRHRSCGVDVRSLGQDAMRLRRLRSRSLMPPHTP